MTRWNQGEAQIKLDALSGRITVHEDVMEVTLTVERDSSQYGTLGSSFKQASIGRRYGEGTLVVPKDNAATSAYYGLRSRLLNTNKDGSFSLEINEPDGNSGSLSISCEIVLVSMEDERNGDGSDIARATFNFLTDGAITEAVIV